MDVKSRLLSAHVLNSKLASLNPPSVVRDAMTNWIREMEQQARSGVLSDEVSVSDAATVELINTPRGPKQ